MVDRISRLSDEVLCHILSFLSTEEAVATSVLSKRWKPLWISVPVLDYDDQIYLRNDKPASCFERFVFTTILARDEQKPITRFRLKYGVSASQLPYFDVSRARSNTVVNAMRRDIQNLDIEMSPTNYSLILRSCILSIFTCRTLVVLKLKGLFLKASGSVDLPSLKSLHLEHVASSDSNYLMHFLYGCPMLEDLKAIRLDYAVWGYDLLEEFKCLPKLVRAHLFFVTGDTSILLKAICNVEFLCMKQYQLFYEVPEFPHLRHLDLYLVTHKWNSVLLMLKNCPKLQSFKLDLRRSSEAVDVLPCPQFIVPECLTSHLKECYLEYYQGTQSDLQFAKYLMQNSTFLQSMNILSISPKPFKALKELALCPRKSASCKLTFNLHVGE